MSLSEKVQQLNREIGSTFERAAADMRQEVSQWLRASSEDLLGRLAELRPQVPESFVAHEDLEPAVRTEAEGLSTQARRGGVAELREALGAIDRARSQAEILNALLSEAGRYSSRAAILLLRGGEVRGWSGQGFSGDEAALRELNLGAPEDGSWSHAFQGQGPARLSAAECAALCSRLDSPVPREGVLVPLVLRDRVAAALYADQTDGAALTPDALQVLCYTAALAIESLPFRERASTATLVPIPDQAEGQAPETTPEPGAETAAEETAVEAPPAEEAVAAAPEPAVDETEPTQTWSPAATSAITGLQETAAVEEESAETEALPASAGWESPGATTSDLEVEVEAEPEPAGASETEMTDEMTAEATPWAAVEEPEPYQLASADDTAAEPVTGWGEPAVEESASPTQQVDLRGLPSIEEPAPAPAAAASSPEATVLLQRSSLREVLSPPSSAAAPISPPVPELVEERPMAPPTPIRPVAPPPPAPVSQGEDTSPTGSATPEVRPPSDVQGPGWAFGGQRLTQDETLHEEARRLARLLVSEIKLYNEEQVEEGRRKRDVYERLREDIDRSRQMYEERVDQRILRSTDYFYQELVRILAAGDARALGI